MKISKLSMVFALFVLAFSDTALSIYAGVFALILLGAYKLIVTNNFKLNNAKFQLVDIVPLLVLMAWLYGVFVGVYFQNNPDYILANFSGLTVFFVYYVLLIIRPNRALLIRILMLSCVIVLLKNILVALLQYTQYVDIFSDTYVQLFLGKYRGGTALAGERMYSALQIVLLPLTLVLFGLILIGKRYRSGIRVPIKLIGSVFLYMLLLLASLYVLVIMSGSKGILLAVLIGMSLVYLSVFNSVGVFKKIQLVFFALSCLVLVVIALQFEVNNELSFFSEDDDGNVMRYYQLTYMLNDLTIIGHGLGAVVSGVIMSDDSPYGYELSYLNLIHKLGVVSIFVFIAYAISFYLIGREFSKREGSVLIYWLSIGCLMYLIPSLGNPIVSHPVFIFMHTIALYFVKIGPEAGK